MILTTNTPYPSRKIRHIHVCTHQKTTKERSSIRRIQRISIRRIQDIVCEDSGRYQTWSLLQETLIRRIQSLGYAEVLIRASRLKKIPYKVMVEPTLEEYIMNAQNKSNLSITSNDINIELSKEFLEELQMNAYHGWIDEDVINHIVMVLKMIDSIYIPESYDGEEEMLDEGDNWGIDPLEFISRVNSSFDKHMKIDGRTKKLLFHAWMNGSRNKRLMDDSILSSNYTATDSFFKPYLITRRKCDTKKEDEQSQTKHKYNNTSKSIDEQPNK
ncbi:hypothetical protein Tco_0851333 [Tanacetum coccineum]